MSFASQAAILLGGVIDLSFLARTEGRRPMFAKTEVASAENVPGPMGEGTEIAGRYRILSLIGEGGMGAVYRAQHLSLRKVFALKVLQPRNVDRPDVIARFEREASDHVADRASQRGAGD